MKKLLALFVALFSMASEAVTPKQAYDLFKEGKAIIVDVREENEVKEEMIEGAKWFAMSKITADENWKKEFETLVNGKQIFLYCRSSNRSGKVKDLLAKEGIKSENIGGMLTLRNELPTKKP